MFSMFSVPWDFFHIGLLIVVIMILITGMVICVSVIGVCCFHWLENLEENESRNNDCERRSGSNSTTTTTQNTCQYDHQNQSVHVVVLPEKLKSGITMDPCQLRDHFQRMEAENSHRRFLSEGGRSFHNELNSIPFPQPPPPDDGPPPPYDALYPAASTVTTSTTPPTTSGAK